MYVGIFITDVCGLFKIFVRCMQLFFASMYVGFFTIQMYVTFYETPMYAAFFIYMMYVGICEPPMYAAFLAWSMYVAFYAHAHVGRHISTGATRRRLGRARHGDLLRRRRALRCLQQTIARRAQVVKSQKHATICVR
ncbi:MAG: hypothetical protein WC374_13465 [Phycisphaerae bacterium]|jgi:hypothetical protein